MPQSVVIATGNAGKVNEFCAILKDSAFSFLASKDVGFSREVEETASTFKGNAEIKAKAVWEYIAAKYKNYWVVADDSGLETEALNGAPGVFSARYAGENATNVERYTKLLKELEGKSNRKARFVCCLCLIRPGKSPEFFQGECKGSILAAPRGNGGFGYDPVFLPDGYDKGFGEMNEKEKNALSHRGRAIRNMLAKLNSETPA
ncbi:MAG: RdgB/HAM1 family non-canonical purine NTP pyrophosphatase [Candidatus Fibromonas sp.]|jgi:XTP/dITP diphosphohydrolase|nr:RdgB/HAM1 family non-canonical purine NTP pyrophosphatase [Candidatus Fibromonas sp.]